MIAVLISLYMWIAGMLGLGLILIFFMMLSYIVPARRWNPWMQRAFRIWLKTLFIRVDVEGLEHIDPDKVYVFMANHVSLFDVPIMAGFLPGFTRGVEADRQFRWPVYGQAVKRFGNIPIDRSSVHKSIASIREAVRRIKEGTSIAIMPEGHRTLDGKMRPFKKLPFFLVKESGKDLVPVGLSGLYHLKAKKSWIIRPTRIKIKFGKPLNASRIAELSTRELMDETRKKIQSLIERP